MHASVLPVTIPGVQPPRLVQSFRPGGGELLEPVLSPRVGGRANVVSTVHGSYYFTLLLIIQIVSFVHKTL